MTADMGPEGWAKAVDVLLSWRRTSKLLLGAVLFIAAVAFGGVLRLTAEADGQVPVAVIAAVVLVLCFAAGALVIDGALGAGSAIAQRIEDSRERDRLERERVKQDERKERVIRDVLRVATTSQLRMLERLLSGSETFVASGDDLRLLEKHSLVHRRLVVDQVTSLYELDPLARPIVEQYLEEQRRNELAFAVDQIGEAERQVLELFLQPAPEGPPKPGDPLMPHDLNSVAQTLVKAGLLDCIPPNAAKTRFAVLTIRADAIEPGESRVLGSSIRRRSIELDPARIASAVNPGSDNRYVRPVRGEEGGPR